VVAPHRNIQVNLISSNNKAYPVIGIFRILGGLEAAMRGIPAAVTEGSGVHSGSGFTVTVGKPGFIFTLTVFFNKYQPGFSAYEKNIPYHGVTSVRSHGNGAVILIVRPFSGNGFFPAFL
jgi:hypothetical protein